MAKKIANPNFEPRLVTSNKTAARQRINADAGSGGVNFTIPMPFRPEFADESRVFYPIDRLQANRHNQLYYKVDGTIGTVIDMYAEIIGSQFHLSGEGVEREVKDAFELSLEKTMAIAAFPMFIKYYLVFGECIPHLTFDTDKKIWTSLMFHNPDQISVTSAPMLKIPDILEFTPDETLRKLARSNHPVIQAAMSTLPPEVLAALISGQGIPLDTITNVTFLARKQFAHETRGTSILSRLYRILMIEDAIANATIQTARRHAGPLKILKVGMMLPDGNPWMPEVGFEDTIVQLLAAAETDPHSFLILPWHVQFEAFGTTDRMLSLRNEYDVIEKIKLTALGVSSEFMHGQCFVPNTNVLTSAYIFKPIQDIKVGDEVVDRNGNVQTVSHAWESHIPETLTEIKLIGGTTLVCTQNHKFPVWAWQRECACGCGSPIKSGQLFKRGHANQVKKTKIKLRPSEAVCEVGRPRFKGILENYNPHKTLEASNIHKYDCLMIPRKFEEVDIKDITLNHAKLLGFYIAEGCYSPPIIKPCKSDSIKWTFNIKEKDTYAKEVIEAGKAIGMDFHLQELEKRSTCTVHTSKSGYSTFYKWLLVNGGRYSHQKQLSSEIMKWPLVYKEELVRSMFKGDGSRSHLKKLKKKTNKIYDSYVVQYGTTSKVLAEQLQIILAQLGIYIVIDRIKKPKDKTVWNVNDAYNLRCYGIHAQKLSKLVWDEDVKVSHTSRSYVWVDDNFLYVPITSVKTITNEQKLPVYNLTVSNDHSYIVEGFGTYNSTYNSMKGQLQVLMMRMSNLRNYFEQMWWLPKFFRPMSELNEFIKPTDAEVAHRVKFRRSKKEVLEDNRYILPTMNWVRQLDPKVDDALLDTYEQIINRIGEPISRSTILSAANLDREVEDNNLKEEKQAAGIPKEKKPSMGGGEIPAEIPEGEIPIEETSEETIELEVPGASKQSNKIPAYQEDLETFIDFIQTKNPTKFWARVLNKDENPEDFIKKLGNGNIERVVDFLEGTGYNYKEIEGFKKDLVNEVEIPTEVKEDVILSMVDKLDATGSGQDIDKAIDTFITTVGKDLGLESLIGKGRLRELDLVKG